MMLGKNCSSYFMNRNNSFMFHSTYVYKVGRKFNLFSFHFCVELGKLIRFEKIYSSFFSLLKTIENLGTQF
jgi:hypothetical protein